MRKYEELVTTGAVERLVSALQAGWVTRKQACGILGVRWDRTARKTIERLKKEYPIMIGTKERPGYKIAKTEEDLSDVRRTRYHYKNMMMDMNASCTQLEIFEERLTGRVA